MAEPAVGRMGADAFLAWAEGREGRWELIDGVPVMMAGAQRRHDQIVVNAIVSLGVQLRGGPCRPFTGDTAVKMTAGNVRRPDVGVECGPVDPPALHAAVTKLVVEVMSPSNRPIDVVRKLDEYRAQPGLDHVLLIEPGTVQALLWSRAGRECSSTVFEALEDVIEIPTLGIRLPLVVLYEDVALPPRLVQ